MRFSKRSKTFAVMTAAAMLLNTTSAIPILNIAAEEEKNVSVTLSDWSETLSFADIPQNEYNSTEITFEPDWTGTVTFEGVESSEMELRQLADETGSGNYGFSVWENRAKIIAAINEKEGTSLSDDSAIQVTDISFEYSWELKSEDEKSTDCYNVASWPDIWGINADGSSSDHGDLFTGYSETKGSAVFSTSKCTDSGVQAIENIDGFGLGMGAWTNNPNDVLEVSVDSITLTVKYVKQYAGGWKSLDSDGKQWGFDHYTDDRGTPGTVMVQVLAAIKEQTGDNVEAWQVQVNDISMDYEWIFDTAMDNPNVDMFPNACGFNGEKWYDANLPEGNTDYKFCGKSGSGSVSASAISKLAGTEITDYHGMFMNIGAWTDDPDDTLTLSLTNITFNVTYQTETSDDDSCQYLTYEELQGAKYVEVGFSINKKGECGHDSHVSSDGVDYSESSIYCAWPIVYVNRISSDGKWSETYEFFQGSSESGYLSVLIPMTNIIDATGELTAGDKLRFSCNDSGVVKELTVHHEGADLKLKTGCIDEIIIPEASDWDDEQGKYVPSGKPDIISTLTIAQYGPVVPFAIEGYNALKINYTLKNPGKCSGIVVILHGWNDNSVGWDERYYEANSSGSIIIDLSDMQEKTFNNIYVGPAALPTAQIGDSFTPCFTVTDAALLTSCTEADTPRIDPIEIIDPPEYDEYGRKTVNVTIDTDWTDTVDFSGVDTVDGEFRHLYSDETQSGNWYINKYENDDNINPEILSALKEQTGDTPCDWPFVINDITAVCEWELTSDESGSGDTCTVQFFPNTCGIADVPESEGSWREASNSDDPSFNLSKKTGSCNISASRIAALSNVTDISDYFGMGLDIGTWSNDPSARLTLRITSVKLNISYVPKNAMYLSYDELKDAKYVKIYSDVAKKTECGHDDPNHIGDDGKSYYDDWTYCPWTSVKVSRISADGTVSNVYDARPDQGDMPSVTAIRSLSDITAVTGELSEGDVLEFAGSSSETVTKVEVIDSLPDIQLDPITIDEVTIEEDTDWDPVLGESVPNGRVGRQYAQIMHNHNSAIKINDYPVVKINYTLKNPDECRAIVVILNGWDENGTGWIAKSYSVSGNSGTIIADFSDLMDKTYYKVFVGVITRPTVKIGDPFTPGFTAEGVIMNSYTGEFTEEYNRLAPDVVLAENIEIVENIYSQGSDDPYVLTKDELAAIEAVLDYDYSK